MYVVLISKMGELAREGLSSSRTPMQSYLCLDFFVPPLQLPLLLVKGKVSLHLHIKVYNSQCTAYSVHCFVYIVHCTVYSV